MHFEPCFFMMDLFKLAVATGASYLFVSRFLARTNNNHSW